MRVGHRLTRQLDALVDRTPADRDRYIDLLRVVSIGVVKLKEDQEVPR
jgi:hypothetical protein